MEENSILYQFFLFSGEQVSGGKKVCKYEVIKTWGRNGGVLIIGYDMFASIVINHLEVLADENKEAIREALLDPGMKILVFKYFFR